MTHGNPNHPVVREVQDQWYKLCAIAIFKSGQTSLEITQEDIERFMASGRANIVVDTRGGTKMLLRLVTDEEGRQIARTEGGLAV